MENRDLLLINFRPNIKIDTKRSTVLEVFQSTTLRPILKLQNQLLIALFRSHLNENKINFGLLTNEKKEELIHTIMKKDKTIKNILIGTIIGFFIEEELLFYFSEKRAINKRIVELLIKRISDQKQVL
jgi:hypothetical protein